jgi:hypothetical protein
MKTRKNLNEVTVIFNIEMALAMKKKLQEQARKDNDVSKNYIVEACDCQFAPRVHYMVIEETESDEHLYLTAP